MAAGLNSLAAMAITISNTSAAYLFHEDDAAQVGTSFTITGVLTDSVSRDVIAQPLHYQQNITRHVAEAHAATAREAGKEKIYQSFDPGRLAQVPKYPAALRVVAEDIGLNTLPLLGEGTREGLGDVAVHPLVVATTDTPAAIEAALKLAHAGRLFVQVPVASVSHAETMAPGLLRIINGTCHGPVCRSVGGHLAATIPPAIFAECLYANNAAANWLGKTVWLSDDAVVPTPLIAQPADTAASPVTAKPAVPVVLVDVYRRYCAALETAIAYRIKSTDDQAKDLRIDYHKRHANFLRFLIAQETACPGITTAARGLYISLEFGIRKMLEAYGFANANGCLSSYDIGALARHLVRGMVHTRSRILESEAQSRLMVLAQRLAIKLEAGPADVRQLVRKTNRLTAGPCTDALQLLLKAGFVRQDNMLWSLTRPASEFLSKKGIVIDV